MPGWLIAILVLVGVWVVAIAGLAVAGRRSAARELATLLPNLVVLFRGLLRDPRVSRGSKALV
jgi:lipopolysaccharide export LptBFGC system permease protein LptF